MSVIVAVGYLPGVRMERLHAALGALSDHYPGDLAADLALADVAGDVEAYWRFLDRIWRHAGRGGHDLVVVEHDIVVHDQVFAQFDACPQPWCSFAYQLPRRVGPALGCARFRHDFIADRPDVWQAAAAQWPAIAGKPGHWSRLDTKLEQTLWQTDRLRIHRHDPPVGHLHLY